MLDAPVEDFRAPFGLACQLFDYLVPIGDVRGLSLGSWLCRVYRAHGVERRLYQGLLAGLHVMVACGGLQLVV